MPMLSRAKSLYEFLDRHSVGNEDLGVLNDDVVATLRDEGFFSMLVPRARGGVEAHPTLAIEIIEELSRADGSAAWVVFATNVSTAAAAAYLDPAISADIFSGVPPIIAGQGAPNGKAVAHGDGFLLTGRWNYGSGILHASHVHACAMILDGDSPRRLPTGEPEIRMFVVPPAEVELHRDWDVIGLRATASIDYSIKNVFVPAAYTYPARQNTSPIGGDVYKLGIGGFAWIGHTGFALGTARRALDELAEIARASAGSPRDIGRSDKFLQDYALAEGAMLSARSWVFDVWGQAERMLRERGGLDVRQITLLRLALNQATHAAVEACQLAYWTVGGRSLRRCPIQRCLRDMLAGAQHIHVSPPVLAECGREISGLAPGATWGPYALVPAKTA